MVVYEVKVDIVMKTYDNTEICFSEKVDNLHNFVNINKIFVLCVFIMRYIISHLIKHCLAIAFI